MTEDADEPVAAVEAAEVAVESARNALTAAQAALDAAITAAEHARATDPLGAHAHPAGVPLDEHVAPKRAFPRPGR